MGMGAAFSFSFSFSSIADAHAIHHVLPSAIAIGCHIADRSRSHTANTAVAAHGRIIKNWL
jgi:hypothetical protein